MRLRGGVCTDPGKRRVENQDSYAFLPERGLVLVADGMGGHADGKQAGRIVAEHAAAATEPDAPPISGRVEGVDDPLPEPIRRVAASITAANRAIFETLSHFGEKTAGSTAVAAVSSGSFLFITNVGDSRAYLVRGGDLAQLTMDHSQVQEMVRAGMIEQREAAGHPLGHMLTRAVGVADSVLIDLFVFEPAPGDRVVLCSDGLTGELSDDRIRSVCVEESDPNRAAERLVAQAVESGGRDNVTVIVADVDDADGAPGAPEAEFVGEVRWIDGPPVPPPAADGEPPGAGWIEPPSIPRETVPPGPSWMLGLALVLIALIAYLVWAIDKT